MARTLPEWVSFAQASLNHDTSFQSHKTSILFYVTKTVSIGFTLHIKKNLYRQKHNNTKITYYHSKTIHGKKKVALSLSPVYPKVNKLNCVHTTCDRSV
jgi:hypothetical protein